MDFLRLLVFPFYSQSQLESCIKKLLYQCLGCPSHDFTTLYDLSRHYFCGQWTGKNIATTSFRMHEIWVMLSHSAVQAFFTQGPHEMCLSLENQNPSKTTEKVGYFDRVTVSLHIL